MNDMRVDLNVFHVFHAVMMEKNVTRAAQRLGMTQPAVSNALSRLRGLLRDDLFTRSRGGVQPTERALVIWPDIQDAIGKIKILVVPPEFEPAKSRQIFNIAVTYPLRYSLVPALATHFAAHAPNLKLHLHPHTDQSSSVELEAGRLDCAVGMFPQPPRGLHVAPLFADDYVCVLRRGHPLLGCRLTLKAFAAANHVLIKSSGGGYSVVDGWLSLKGLTRQISLVVNQFEDALEVLKNTNLVAAIPHRLARMAIRADCKIVKLPFASEKILYKMLWHERTNSNAAQIWLRSTIRTLLMESYVQSKNKSDVLGSRT